MLIIHIFLALTSVLYSFYTSITPSNRKVFVTGIAFLATLASGALLTITTHANIVKVCISGVVYSAIVLTNIIITRKKILRVQKNITS
ncbi:MAG TPA: hypothetical protein VI819_05150 [Patescibacteria group bacterium]|nr:hypothetical protein [Patescibacteria group bacterium]